MIDTALFVPVPLDWYRHPKCRKLRTADPANEGRWLFLVSLAHHCRMGGRLVASDGTALDAEDFAYEHDRNDEGWLDFIKVCKKLDLVALVDGVLEIVAWKSWSRETVLKREADRDRKREERARSSEPVQTCPEVSETVQGRPNLSEDKNEPREGSENSVSAKNQVTEPTDDDPNDPSGSKSKKRLKQADRASLSEPVRSCPNPSEKVALDQIRSDQSRSDQIPPYPPEGNDDISDRSDGQTVQAKLQMMEPSEIYAQAHRYLLKNWKRPALSAVEEHELRHLFDSSELEAWHVLGLLAKASKQVLEVRSERQADPKQRRYLSKKPIADVIEVARDLVTQKLAQQQAQGESSAQPLRNLSAEWREEERLKAESA